MRDEVAGALPHAIAFVDPCAPRPYSAATASLARLGGTEKTLVTLVQDLAAAWRVDVLQGARAVAERQGGVSWSPFDIKAPIPADVIVVVNSWKVAVSCARRNPGARVLLWLHVFPGKHNREMGSALREAGVEVVFVSASHRDAVLRGIDIPPVSHVVYNMIPDTLLPDATPRNDNKLFFASAPHKGLRQVLHTFARLRQWLPELELHLADPGYLDWDVGDYPAGVVRHGHLDRHDVWRHMRESLCLFCPQSTFAETFGIVIAEANAVGTPALLQAGLGANDEVASSFDQCIDVTDIRLIVSTLRRWQSMPAPRAVARPEFRQSAVLERWSVLLGPRAVASETGPGAEASAALVPD